MNSYYSAFVTSGEGHQPPIFVSIYPPRPSTIHFLTACLQKSLLSSLADYHNIDIFVYRRTLSPNDRDNPSKKKKEQNVGNTSMTASNDHNTIDIGQPSTSQTAYVTHPFFITPLLGI